MNINYTFTNNLCSNNNYAYIIISQILFDNNDEAREFAEYSVQWSNNISPSQIASDGRLVSRLPNGTYTFRLISLISGAQSSLYTIVISSPDILEITSVNSNNRSCGRDGEITININGGKAPYIYYVNSIFIESTSLTTTFSDLDYGTYTIKVVDANGCQAIYNDTVKILDSSIVFKLTHITSPQILDGSGSIEFSVTGYGPFNLLFQAGEYVFSIDSTNNSYITKVDDNIFYYKINQNLYPNKYNITITDTHGCTLYDNIVIPNIAPIKTNISVVDDNPVRRYYPLPTLNIYDTFLVPYKHILENSKLWQTILKYNLKNDIYLKINEEKYNFNIVRTMLDKYHMDESKVEILKLGKEHKDWFFYFYIAPSIDLTTNPEFYNASIVLLNQESNEEFTLKLGLNHEGDLDRENPSLIRGSILIQHVNNYQFTQNACAYIKIENDNEYNNYDFRLEGIKINILTNIYSAGFVTSLSFLEQFGVLNSYITIGTTSYNMSPDQCLYVDNIKNFLCKFNNTAYNNSFIVYNLDNVQHNGLVNIFISGNDTFISEDKNTINNQYNIDYFTFDRHAETLSQFYINNEQIKNHTSLTQLDARLIIVKISDLYNNKTKIINNNILYDTHFIQAQKMLKDYNSKILNQFVYGDILIAINYNELNLIEDPDNLIPKYTKPIQPNTHAVGTASVVKLDKNNTPSLTINTNPPGLKCLVFGPKNYTRVFTSPVDLTNLIPGVYVIRGDDQDLLNKNLHQNENRFLVTENNSHRTHIEFPNYINKVIIKEK